MSEQDLNLKQISLSWLKEKVFPLWLKEGVDSQANFFIENLNFEGKAQVTPRRALVQARQIYSFAEGARLHVLDQALAKQIVESSTRSFIKLYSLSNGAFVHSVSNDGKHLNFDVDLYTQAFALFGLAQAFEFSQGAEFKVAALKLYSYLNTERRNKAGGFTEIKDKKLLFQSNPHMHLFESALAWLKIDSDPIWKSLANELYDLCTDKFIDSKTGLLAEHFDQNWKPIRTDDNFIFEPGHLYEWSWLFYQYRKLIHGDNEESRSLFNLAEKFGLSANQELAFDEIWSNGKVNKSSSRFWPQCERIKSAAILNENKVADVAMKSLMDHFLDMNRGLWKDTLLESGQYADIPVKASSLYHIINAISEFVAVRPKTFS